MDIQEMICRLPGSLGQLVVFEQSNLWKAKMWHKDVGATVFDTRYLPESHVTFKLPCLLVERGSLYLYGECNTMNATVGFDEGDGPKSRVVFPIHPAEWHRFRDILDRVGAVDAGTEGVDVWATPTSSTRTVLAWPAGEPKNAFFVKLSLSSSFLGDRRLTRHIVARSVGLSQVVQRGESDLPSGVGYFAEPAGGVPRVMPDSGVVVRHVPEAIRDGSIVLAPVFALMGGDSEHRPLLLRLMEIERVGARELLEEVIIRKFAYLWVELTFEFGLILEAHGQDLLVALSRALEPLGKFYYRDFEGLTVDWALRRARALVDPESLPHAFDWFRTYETWGYPLYQLVSQKMMISLFQYIHLVLMELESALMAWTSSGRMSGEKVSGGELTFLFSRYLRKAIREKYGMTEFEEYNIQQQLVRFVRFLMQVRREIIRCLA